MGINLDCSPQDEIVRSAKIRDALEEIERTSPNPTDGKWLERLTAECAPLLAEWDVGHAWMWDNWPDRETHYPDTPDIGADVVAQRKNDGKLIAIQCKSRKLDDHGRGADIRKQEFNGFLDFSSPELWAERWLVVIGATNLGTNAAKVLGQNPVKPVKHVNIESDLRKQLDWDQAVGEDSFAEGEVLESRDDMQRRAIDKCVSKLRKWAHDSETGRARGRLILPCGTGKSRIALRIIEALTELGQVAAVLCPSISLVAQLRGEFLNNCVLPINVLAVCSDEGVAKDKDLESDPTADIGHAKASEVKGAVTTDPEVIGQWIDAVLRAGDCIGVIFGTYQSSHRIGDALVNEGQKRNLQILIADEAHRTAGLRKIPKMNQKLRDFAICHDDVRFPATYRVYQTATPRVYHFDKRSKRQNQDWIVRDMNDETVFGPELDRRSYAEAVANGWLTDYRIIAIGVNDRDAYDTANALAEKHGRKLSTAHFLRGLTLALTMSGALQDQNVDIRSSINFMNKVDRSKSMADALQTPMVRDWVKRRLEAEGVKEPNVSYLMEHLDASNAIADRENAKARLMAASEDKPFGILNVGIFGEGVDAPSLSAVGFLEARRSPVDVIQAVGRVMRRSVNKTMGYIICPIVIPPNVDAETWLETHGPDDGWQELGQILLALRAHDGRIEEKLSDLMQIYLPPPPAEDVATMVTVGGDDRRVTHYVHIGPVGAVENAVENVVTGKVKPRDVFKPLRQIIVAQSGEQFQGSELPTNLTPERIVSGKQLGDGSAEIRHDGVIRKKSATDGTRGSVDVDKSKQKGRKMVNGAAGRLVEKIKRREQKNRKNEQHIRGLFDQVEEVGITINLLEKSGLGRNRAERDVNILQDSIQEATRCLKEDKLDSVLDQHFGLDMLDPDKRKTQADGCTIAALLMMNAAMLHQRIAAGGWLPKISGMDTLKSAPNAADDVLRQWNHITRHDFRAIIEPAIELIDAVLVTGKRSGINQALRHLAGEAERIAEDYADLGTDHAGPLFNRVMGNQKSDGAFFTRPPAAALLARLTLDLSGPNIDWTSAATWKDHRTTDLACGSGTLIAAILTDMKRRAQHQGASRQKRAKLQKLAVEEVITGLDFNPVSLQLAAAQLTAGNSDVAYREIRLYSMPYGLISSQQMRVGTPELFGQKRILPKQLDLEDELLGAEKLRMGDDDPLLENAVDAVSDVRIVIMNPPFSNRSDMGEKFPKDFQRRMRERVDRYESELIKVDPKMRGFADKNSIRPLFVALAERCLNQENGVLAMINPTTALTAPSGHRERVVLTQRFHIHTLLTSFHPQDIFLSQHTSINESMIVAKRWEGERPPTRIINLDRFPHNDQEVAALHQHLSSGTVGLLPDGWGEVSEWPAYRIAAGDWSAVIFRSPLLADAAYRFSTDDRYPTLATLGMTPADSGRLLRGSFQVSDPDTKGSFPILKSKGAEGQLRIRARPDEYWVPKEPARAEKDLSGTEEHPKTAKLLQKAGYLLLTAGQDISTARLTAVASDEKYVGNGWLPVSGLTAKQAMATAVCLNSTFGRLQLMRNAGRKLSFPTYSVKETERIRIPNIRDEAVCAPLVACWEVTADTEVPQFKAGECAVRRRWDEAVAGVLGYDANQLADLRHLLHDEPYVRNLGYGQFDEEKEQDVNDTRNDRIAGAS